MALFKVSMQSREGVKPVHSGEFTPLTAGGYVCKIVEAEVTESKAGNPMLALNVDIAEGDFAGYFQSFADRFHNWNNNAVVRQLIFESPNKPKGEHENNSAKSVDKVSGRFLGLVENIEDSNPNFIFWTNGEYINPDTLKGKFIGVVFAEEEYQKQNGDLAIRAIVKFTKSVSDIRDGDFTVPPLKKMDASKIKPKTNSDAAKKFDSPAPFDDPPFY